MTKKCKAVWNMTNEIIYGHGKAWEPSCLLINNRAVSQPKDI